MNEWCNFRDGPNMKIVYANLKHEKNFLLFYEKKCGWIPIPKFTRVRDS